MHRDFARRASACSAGILVGLLLIAPAAAQHKPGEGKSGAGHHQHRFDDPAKWSKAFDDPERDAWQKPAEVIAALALKPNARVADIGAGTGYFTVRLARALPGGSVLAVDVEPNMVAHLAERAKSLGLANVRAVQASETSPNLPEPVDVVLVVNAYHHIAERPAYFRRLAASLQTGGRIAIIDQRLDAPRGPPKHLRMSVEAIDAEMKLAGYARIAQHDFLPNQNFVVYRIADH